MFKIITTKTFLNELNKFLDGIEKKKFIKFKDKLKLNPYLGKGLRFSFVREFKTSKGKRAYFIVYEEFKIVLFVACGNKKDQENKIGEIFIKLDIYYVYVKNYNS